MNSNAKKKEVGFRFDLKLWVGLEKNPTFNKICLGVNFSENMLVASGNMRRDQIMPYIYITASEYVLNLLIQFVYTYYDAQISNFIYIFDSHLIATIHKSNKRINYC